MMTESKIEVNGEEAKEPVYDQDNPPPPPTDQPPPPNYPHPDDVEASSSESEEPVRKTKSRKNRKAAHYTYNSEPKELDELRKEVVSALSNAVPVDVREGINEMSEEAADTLANKLQSTIKELTSATSQSATEELKSKTTVAVNEAMAGQEIDPSSELPDEASVAVNDAIPPQEIDLSSELPDEASVEELELNEVKEVEEYMTLQQFINSLDIQMEIFTDNTTSEGPVDKAVRTLIKEIDDIVKDPNTQLTPTARLVANAFVKELIMELVVNARDEQPESKDSQLNLAKKCLEKISEYQPRLEPEKGLWDRIKEVINKCVEAIFKIKDLLETKQSVVAPTLKDYKNTIINYKNEREDPEPDPDSGFKL